MVDVVVTGVGLWTALGTTVQATWSNLLAGNSAIALRQPFLSLPPMPMAMIDKHPADPEQLVIGAVKAAMADAAMAFPATHCGLVVGSSRSYLNRWERMAQNGPDHWMATLPSRLSGQIAQAMGTKGPVLAPMAACATGLWALFQGYLLLVTGQCKQVVVAAVDAPITALTLTGFWRMGAMAKDGCYPFDCDRNGLVLGEGAAAVVLENRETTLKPSPYGRILGFGLSNDASHISSPQPKEALQATHQCLRRSGLTPRDISYIHTHGTGTRLNDANEAHLVQQLFPQAAVSATKGATGHTLGAAGLIGTVFSLLSLQQQRLPPCVGLTHPEFELNYVRGEACCSMPIRQILCTSFGFGGQNAIVALGCADSAI